MKKLITMFCAVMVLIPILNTTCTLAETASEEAEQGLTEIQPLMIMTEIPEAEGMSLEEMTDSFADSAMSEYIDSKTGFSMQYPSAFVFDEETKATHAVTEDGQATLSIDHMENQVGLDEYALTEAIRYEKPDVKILKNEQNGCLRIDFTDGDGKQKQTDLYLLTSHYLHHIVMRYPAEEQGTYLSYIEYMINTIETNETDLG